MKKMKFLRSFVAGLSVAVCLSCSSNDDDGIDDGGDAINVQELTTITTSGTWRVASYVEDGEDETHHFTGYSFTFNSNGTVAAVNGDTTINGTWAISDDDDDDDDDDDGLLSSHDFIIAFNVDDDSDFDDLNDDWDIESYTNNRISLLDDDDDDDDDDDTEILVFEKN